MNGYAGFCNQCNKARTKVWNCNDCLYNFCNNCIPNVKHNLCNTCNGITCNGISCKKCECSQYIMVTNTIAIGNKLSYFKFDCIIEITNGNDNIIKYNYVNDNKIIIQVQFSDSIIIYDKLVPILLSMNNSMILFQCDDESISSAFVIAYIAKKDNMTWFDAYNFVKLAKDSIKPNLELLKRAQIKLQSNFI